MANDANTKYNSRAAQMYREKIRQLGSAALARHGTDVSAGSWARVLESEMVTALSFSVSSLPALDRQYEQCS